MPAPAPIMQTCAAVAEQIMNEKELSEAVLWYRRNPAPGTPSIAQTTRLDKQRNLLPTYSPWDAHACEAIVADEREAFR